MSVLIPYTHTRNSVAARIDVHRGSETVAVNIPVIDYPGVRGGGGFLIMPAVTQQLFDNYFDDGTQTADAALAAPWTATGDNARTANALLGGLSCELAAAGELYQATAGLAAATATLSAFVYCPPPARIDLVKLWWEGVEVTPSGVVSLGGYWYFVWYSATANGASQQYGVANNTANLGSIWVDCLSLTQTAAPVGFVPNSSTDSTQASADDNLKFTLSEPLPQSGSISFVYIPFYDLDGSAVDPYPFALSFFSSGGDSSGDDRLQIPIYDDAAGGLYIETNKDGAGTETTSTDGYAAQSDWVAFCPLEFVIDWDFAPGGTKLVRFWVNGELQVESNNITRDIAVNLVDMWVGVQRDGGSSWANHAQGILSDIQIHRR